MSMIKKLRDFTSSSHPFGNEEGRKVFIKLSDFIGTHSVEKIIGISLDGIEATDASFPRESVISIIKVFKGERGFYLIDLVDKDLIDNWHYAAAAKDESVILKTDQGYKIIGIEISSGDHEILDFIMKEGEVNTSKIKDVFKLTAPNAGAKLKRLHAKGLILSKKAVAETGGHEFIYTAIK